MLYLAFRNCCRNLRRSLLTALALFLAVLVIAVMICFCDALLADMVDNSLDYTSGEIRIRKQMYSDNEDLMPLQFYIQNAEAVAELIRSCENVEKVYLQSAMYLSVYTDGDLRSVRAVGADTEFSSYTTGSGYTLNKGRMIRMGESEILVTPRLLLSLSLEVGDSLTLVSKTATGGTNGSTFLIAGSVSYDNAELNGDLIVMPQDMLASLARMEGGALEILVRCDEDHIDPVMSDISNTLRDASLEIASWHETSFLYPFLPIYDMVYLCIEMLFFLIASTLIFNTVMMSVLERKREISTMAALGFSRSSIRSLFILEGAMISASGAFSAGVFSLLVMYLLSVTGIDLTVFGIGAVSGWGFSSMLYPSVDIAGTVLISLAAVFVAVMVTFLATGRIRRIEVADALREEA